VDTEGGIVFEKNPLYLPELGANFRKETADISRQSRCRGSVSIIGTCNRQNSAVRGFSLM
jgi:hypothetical protein